MSEIQKPALHAYLVALQWSDGLGSTNAYLGVRPEEASAAAVVQSMRTAPPSDERQLTAVMVHELPIEWLRWAVASIERGAPASASVVSLVQPRIAMPWPTDDPGVA
jgi:hypothetical protein